MFRRFIFWILSESRLKHAQSKVQSPKSKVNLKLQITNYKAKDKGQRTKDEKQLNAKKSPRLWINFYHKKYVKPLQKKSAQKIPSKSKIQNPKSKIKVDLP